MADDPTLIFPDDPEGVKERIRKVTKARDAAVASLEAAAPQLAGLETLRATLATQTATIESMKSGRAEDLALVSRGLVDPEAMEIARTMHQRTDGSTPLVDWVGGFMAEPTTAPGWLKGYIGQPAPPAPPSAPPTTTEAPPTTTTAPTAPVIPPANNLTRPPPVNNGKLTAEQIRALPAAEFQKRLEEGTLL